MDTSRIFCVTEAALSRQTNFNNSLLFHFHYSGTMVSSGLNVYQILTTKE